MFFYVSFFAWSRNCVRRRVDVAWKRAEGREIAEKGRRRRRDCPALTRGKRGRRGDAHKRRKERDRETGEEEKGEEWWETERRMEATRARESVAEKRILVATIATFSYLGADRKRSIQSSRTERGTRGSL